MLEKMLILHEGIKLKVYKCPSGFLTIGVGRNLEGRGITREEALFLLRNDIETSRKELTISFPWFKELDRARQDALIDMNFMGINKFKQFKLMIAAFEEKDYVKAAKEMLDSNCGRKARKRVNRLASIIITGQYPLDVR